MDFGQAFTFVFKDPDWVKKVLIAALISIIPIIGQLYLLGWGLEITRRVAAGETTPLIPETDFGGFLGRGFKAAIVGFVYAIPIYIIMAPIVATSFGLESAGVDEETLALVTSMVSLCCGCLMVLYAILINFLLPAAFANMTIHNSIGAGLRFREVFGLVKASPVSYLIALLGVMVAGLVGSLGTIACGIGVLLTYAYAMLIMGHFYGQAYTQSKNILSAKGY